jgi:hypothetical protein
MEWEMVAAAGGVDKLINPASWSKLSTGTATTQDFLAIKDQVDQTFERLLQAKYGPERVEIFRDPLKRPHLMRFLRDEIRSKIKGAGGSGDEFKNSFL